MSEKDESEGTRHCDRCMSERLDLIDARIAFQGAIPLIVFDYRCLDCHYRWTDAREPAIRSETETTRSPQR